MILFRIYINSHQVRALALTAAVEITMIPTIAPAGTGVIKIEMLTISHPRIHIDRDHDLLLQRVLKDQLIVGTYLSIPLTGLLLFQWLYSLFSHLILNGQAIASAVVNILLPISPAKKALKSKLLLKILRSI